MDFTKTTFLTVAFIEGGSLMAVELIGAKLINPFFGISPYVWASVLALTLLGLAFGYLAGGMVSNRSNNLRILTCILLVSSILVFLLPKLSSVILPLLITHTFEWGILLSAFIVLVPAFFFFGMVSPIIISLINSEKTAAGKSAGIVYALSTLGGILFTFMFGFYFIPYAGVKESSFIIGVCLFVAFLLLLIISRISETKIISTN